MFPLLAAEQLVNSGYLQNDAALLFSFLFCHIVITKSLIIAALMSITMSGKLCLYERDAKGSINYSEEGSWTLFVCKSSW